MTQKSLLIEEKNILAWKDAWKWLSFFILNIWVIAHETLQNITYTLFETIMDSCDSTLLCCWIEFENQYCNTDLGFAADDIKEHISMKRRLEMIVVLHLKLSHSKALNL
jgi:hypothetical protein